MISLTRAWIVFLGAAILAQGQEYVISTFAGGAPPPTPVSGVNMGLGTYQGGSVQSVGADAAGNTYFVAFHCVFKLDQNGVVTRIAGNARAGYSGDGGPANIAQLRLESFTVGSPISVADGALPPGMAIDNGGSVYVADNGNYRIRRISPDGIITTVAGNGTPGFSGDGGPATSAQLSPALGLAVDVAGNLWIADSGAHRIRRVTPDGSIATVAGTGDCGFSGDGGPAVAAQLCAPTGLAADAAGNLFVTDSENNRIRRISLDGTITTVAGTGQVTELGINTTVCATGVPAGDGGPATRATLCLPSNVAVDRAGNLFVADTYILDDQGPSQVVRKITPSGGITTVAGFVCEMGYLCASLPDSATATKTYLGGPLGLAVDNAGNVIIGDGLGRVHKVSSDGAIAIVAGNGENPFSGDGGPATSAQMADPLGLAADGAGNLFIADFTGFRVRKVSPDGIIGTVAGNGTWGFTSDGGDGGPATSAQVQPLHIAVDGAGGLLIGDGGIDRIRKITPDGIIATIAGNDSRGFSGDGGPATSAKLGIPYGVAADRAGNVYIADFSNFRIRRISPGGIITTVAGNGTDGSAGDGGLATSAQLEPFTVAVDAVGNLFIADLPNHRIRKVTPDGIITTIAGNGAQGFSGDGGPAIDAQLSFPFDVAVDAAGNLFIADEGNNRIRKVSPDGIITTIAGDGIPGYSGDGHLAVRASLSGPSALAVDGAGNVYVADNNAIRILRPARTGRRMPRD